jgi:hypothetical protein
MTQHAKPRHPLVANEFDLVPDSKGRGLGSYAWIDQATGFRFGMMPSRGTRPRFYIEDRNVQPAQTIVLVEIEELSKRGYPRNIVYQMSRMAVLRRVNDSAVRHAVDAFKGEETLFAYCIKAIRACHVRSRPIDSGSYCPDFEFVAFATESVEVQLVD